MGHDPIRLQLKLRYKPGRNIGNADACSRLSLQLPSTTEEEQPETIQFLQQLESSPVLARDVRRWTKQDPILSRVQYYVHHGWPNKPLIEALTPYWRSASELSREEGCVLWGYKVIAPPQGNEFWKSYMQVILVWRDERVIQNDSLVARTGWGHRTQGSRLF